MALLKCPNEICIGTNEEFVLGYQVIPDEEGNVSLELSFANHSHSGRVKQVAINNAYLVSGGTDEFIKIFNMKTRREVGCLLPHDGTITCLQFHSSGYLFSGAEDGKINIFKAGKWNLEKELAVGNTGVNGIAIHPSGKLALSISKNKKLSTWDLMKGKRVFIAALKKAGEYVTWSPTASHYLIAALNVLDIYDVETANIEQSIDFGGNIYCLCFITNDLLVIGGEKKSLSLFSLSLRKELVTWEAHETRTKCLSQLDSGSDEVKMFASASSDGFIKIWSINLKSVEDPPKLLGEVKTKCRIICMAVYSRSKEIPLIKQNKSITQSTKNKSITQSTKNKSNKLIKRKKNSSNVKTQESVKTKKNINTKSRRVVQNQTQKKKVVTPKVNNSTSNNKKTNKGMEEKTNHQNELRKINRKKKLAAKRKRTNKE